jgi:hypothetical protein
MMNIDEAQFVLASLTTDQFNTILTASAYAQRLGDPTTGGQSHSLGRQSAEASVLF